MSINNLCEWVFDVVFAIIGYLIYPLTNNRFVAWRVDLKNERGLNLYLNYARAASSLSSYECR